MTAAAANTNNDIDDGFTYDLTTANDMSTSHQNTSPTKKGLRTRLAPASVNDNNADSWSCSPTRMTTLQLQLSTPMTTPAVDKTGGHPS
jgi:hypothetical protein